VRDAGVVLEMCPSSNCLTRAVAGIQYHPIKLFLDSGIKVCINTDDPGIMDLTLQGEYHLLQKAHQFTAEDFKKTNLIALNASFLPSIEIERVQKAYFDPE